MNEEEEFEQNKIVKYISFSISFCFILLFGILYHFYESSFIEFRYLIILPISIVVYLFLAYPIYINAYKALVHEKEIFNEDTLIIISSIASFVLAYIPNNAGEINLSIIYEGIIVNLLFLIGETFEDFAKERSEKHISSLTQFTNLDQRVKNQNNEFEFKNIDDVEVNEIVHYFVGEKVALDIELLSSSASVDQKSLTGESVPINKEQGEIVYSGSIVLENNIFGRVIKNSKDSTISKIAELIENSTKSKAKAEKFIHRFAKIYTPIVILITLVTAIVGGWLSGDWNSWIYESVCILIVACPCSLIVSIPLAYIVGIGRAGKEGVLIKGGNYLDVILKTSTIAFDKTGTLTKGNLKVSSVEIKSDLSFDEIIKIAANLEQNSNHPIAKAITEYAKKYVKIDSDITVNEIPGVGVCYVDNEENTYHLGSNKLYPNLNKNDDRISVVLLKNDQLIAVIYLEDEYKDGIKVSIDQIRKSGINNLNIVSGDKKSIVQKVANELEIDNYYSELLPSNKVETIESLKNSRGSVIFVGDGINDAPSIAASNCGISMGLIGSDTAIESSDVVILNDDISKIAWLKKLSKIIHFIVVLNIVLSLLTKLVIIVLSIIPYTSVPLYLSIFGDVGILIICVINSLLCAKIKITI